MLQTKRAVLYFLTALATTPIMRADSFSFSGNFRADDEQAVFNFTTIGQGIFSVQTFSYGGGTDYRGTLVPSGGFAPFISIFDSTGMLQAVDYAGGTVGAPGSNGCQGRAVDSSTNACEDAAVYGTSANHLNAGTYLLVLTQSQNYANGSSLSDGFSEDTASCPYSDGCAAYTGENSGLPGEMFVDPADHTTQRTSRYEISFTGDDLASAAPVTGVSPVPEPGTFSLLLTGVLGTGAFGMIRAAKKC